MRVTGGILMIQSGVLLGAALLCACSIGGQAKPGTAAVTLPDVTASGSHEERLRALEAAMQQLAQRVEALQAAGAPLAGTGTDQLPAEYRPIRPGIVLAVHSLPKGPAPAALPVPTPEPAPMPKQRRAPELQPPGQGDWVINLASYTSQGFARKKLVEFVEVGVAVEQVQAVVNGSTVYRLRVPGFESFHAASTQAGTIQEKLGLKDTWVARR